MVDCPQCGGTGYQDGYGHGCDGTDEDCARTCPVQIQEPCGFCGGYGEVPKEDFIQDE